MAAKRDPAIRVMMLPRDTNGLGTIFGGIILSYLDLAGEIEARRHGPRRFVTVAMREVVFSAPVYVGDVVSFYARTVRVGRTSVTVQVEVKSERRNRTGETVEVTKAEVVYVAVDETGKSIPIKDDSV
ncbi:MAG: acyl-CoA thioesterase [Candidatus Latescibacteria bacterium]|nr:acyl-CoA thioesterase [Candidatus Latescibacterota bacterium]